jgi:hypothetical protein
MDTGLLERAKRLNAAANAIANELTTSLNGINSDIQRRIDDKGTLTNLKMNVKSTEAAITEKKTVQEALDNDFKVFKGAVFNGSSLLTTFQDLRPFLNKGNTFYVDDIVCSHKVDGEMSASRIELSEDFVGSTNFDAYIKIKITKGTHKKSRGKNIMLPVDSQDIKNALRTLDNIEILSKSSSPSKDKTRIPTLKKSEPTHRIQLNNTSPRAAASLKDAGGFYTKEELLQRHDEMSTRIVEKAKERASRRAAEYVEEQRELEQRRKVEEQIKSQEMHARYDSKVQELQQKTAQRVRDLRRDKYLRDREEREHEAEERVARLERETLARAQGQVDRIRALGKETMNR